MPRLLRTLAAAGLLLLLAAAPARAGEMLVVDGAKDKRVSDPLVPSQAEIALTPPARSAVPRAGVAAGSPGAVLRALRRARAAGHLDQASYDRFRRSFARARSVVRRLRGRRRGELAYQVRTLERIAQAGRLIPSRIRGLFGMLERNTAYWPSHRFPASGELVGFRGTEILYRYFPGRGLQIHPLATFKKANLMHGACTGVVCAPCRRKRLRILLDQMRRLAVRRHPRFIAWEYSLDFGGGRPPWISGMAEATALQAYARGGKLLGKPSYAALARRALGAFEIRPPVGVRARGPLGGVHYLQYSFAPRLFIFNAFTQAELGLWDFWRITRDARARRLFEAAEPELRREIPHSDTGSWSRYSYGGARATVDYHELLREVLQSACNRSFGDVYCRYARRYLNYERRRGLKPKVPTKPRPCPRGSRRQADP